MKNSDNKKFKPPRGLSTEAKRWWNRVVAEWSLDDVALLLLQGACECLDRMREAQAALKKEGLVVKDRFGQPKQNPNLLTERDAKQGLLRHIKALNLDLEPLNDRPGRPPGS